MSAFARISPRLWMLCVAAACGFLVWSNRERVARIEHVSALVEADSPTGYTNGQRELIVPERNESSFHWIAQTQQMLARGEFRVRHVDYENAPQGRDVHAAAPYRWWLGFVAWLDHAISGRSLGASVERAALWADPLLHALLLLGATLLVAWRFGNLAASLLAIGLATCFPFAAGFLPGAPDDHGLANACAIGSVLVLLIGLNKTSRRWFALAGVIGGFGVWLSVSTQVPIVAGVFFGALLATWIARSDQHAPWRTWALSGAATIVVAWLIENFPEDLASWRLESVHPLYALAWLGAGELLARAEKNKSWRRADLLVGTLAVLAIAALPIVMWATGSRGFLAHDFFGGRLMNLPGGAIAATLAPLHFLLPATWLLLGRATNLTTRVSLAIALGPVLVALGFATQQLRWWSTLDGALLVLVVVIAATARASRWISPAIVMLVAALGVARLLPPASGGAELILTSSESEQLVERHLAHWLAKRAGDPGAVIYAPPNQTTSLCFYGGLRGIGTFATDNRTGFGASLMIAGAATMEEAQEQLQARGVRFVVVPSWDHFFDEFAQLYLTRDFSNRTSLFIRELRRLNVPLWLRPVPYQIPVSGGFAGQSVLIFEVVDEQSPAVAASRMAEYLVEIGEIAKATGAIEALRRFPGDVGALAAAAQVQIATGDAAGAAKTLETLQTRLAGGGDRYLPWDRRVSLAIVLARGDRIDAAREQVRRCAAEASDEKLRSLSAGSLYGLLVLSKALEVPVNDPKLRELALDLLPGDLRKEF